MSINLQGPGSPGGAGGPSGSGPAAGGAQVLAWAQGFAAALPGVLQALPGDPVAARHVGAAAGGALLLAALLGALGALSLPGCAPAHLNNLYGAALAALTLVLEADVKRVAAAREAVLAQARILGQPLGLAGLHLVQGSLALAQGSGLYVLAGLAAFAAAALEALVWRARAVALEDHDGTGLIAGQSEPLPAEPRNMDIIMQHC